MPTLEEKRVFLAINLTDNAKTTINDLLIKLRKNIEHVKWVDSAGLHVNLHFLGNLNAYSVDRLIVNLHNLEGRYNGEMTFAINGLNAFPNIHNPRIIFLDCKQQTGASIMKLHKEILDELIKLNLDIDLRRFYPHITLGRAKSKINSRIFSQYGLSEKLFFSANSFELMESDLKPGGAEYKVIKSFKL